MQKSVIIRSLALVACLLLVAGCGDCSHKPTLNTDIAIKLAKENAATASSPPRVYSQVAAYGPRMTTWPDHVEAQTTHDYRVCYYPYPTCAMTVTLITADIGCDDSQDIIFEVNWETTYAKDRHSWRFRVGDDGLVNFVGEDGGQLPRGSDG